jgi:CRP-like cAMP-binding protein
MRSFPSASQLSELPLFTGCDEASITPLVAASRERRFAKGQHIFRVGDHPTGLYFVISGSVKESCVSRDGRERIIELVEAPQSFGEAALFEDCCYRYQASAIIDSRLLHIEKFALLKAAHTQPQILRRSLQLMSQRVRTLEHDIEASTFSSNVQRVAGYLVDRCNTVTGRRAEFVLPVFKQVIAARLGMTPENMSRNLRELALAGTIEVKGNCIRVHNLDLLRSLAGDQQTPSR